LNWFSFWGLGVYYSHFDSTYVSVASNESGWLGGCNRDLSKSNIGFGYMFEIHILVEIPFWSFILFLYFRFGMCFVNRENVASTMPH
jgi:hypothetical protein